MLFHGLSGNRMESNLTLSSHQEHGSGHPVGIQEAFADQAYFPQTLPCETVFSSKVLAITNDRQDASLNCQMLISKLPVSSSSACHQWDEPHTVSVKAAFLLRIYFEMQRRAFQLEEGCGRVSSLSSNIDHRPAEEM